MSEPEQRKLFDTADVRCPACGYSPYDDTDEGVTAGGLACRNDPPACREEALDCFEVLGMAEGCVECPRCGREVNLETGEVLEWDAGSEGEE